MEIASVGAHFCPTVSSSAIVDSSSTVPFLCRHSSSVSSSISSSSANNSKSKGANSKKKNAPLPQFNFHHLPPHSPFTATFRLPVIYDSKKKGGSFPVSVGEETDREEDEDGPSSSTSSFLSLSEKPDRNIALLDEYEMEELDDGKSNPNHRSGFVAVLGKPNVGKSTLSNQIVGQKLSIVTDKPQTTRHRILGICSETDYQMILFDTPGVIEKKMHKLDSMMMNNVRSAAVNADCVLVVVDACKVPQKIDEILEEGIGNFTVEVPILLVLNKKDLVKPGEIAKRIEWYEKFTNVDEVIPVSAKYGQGVDDIKEWVLSKLPLGPAYYPKGIASEHPERFFIAEIVREKIFLQYRNEIPYACQVNVVNYITRPTSKDYISIEIVVEKETQKMILIGREGRALKLLATAARLDIEDFLQKKVFLEVEVKVKVNWREDEDLLKHYGYGGQIRVL